MSLKNKAWLAFKERKGERWLFEATHSAKYHKLRRVFYEGFEEGVLTGGGLK